MTSGISFRKLLGRNLKKRAWLIVLMTVACVIVLPIRLFVELDMMDRVWYSNELLPPEMAADRLYSFQSLAQGHLNPNYLMLLCVVFAAVLAGVTGFAYLHSKEKVDYYHSFAIRREKYFFVPYLGGVIACVGPYLLSVAACLFIVLPIKGIFSGSILAGALVAALDLIVYFLAVYTVVCLGMMLAGRILTGILLSALILGFGPVSYMLYTTLMQMSFRTYFASADTALGYYLSPVTMGFLSGQGLFDGGILILLAAIAAAVLILTVFLYRKRPSEAAEQPLAYRPMHSVIKVIATVPGALIFGMLFTYMFGLGRDSKAAFIIWTLVGAFLINWLIEFIYSTDLKNVARHWRSGVLIGAAVAVILLFFEADLFGFDRKIPAKESLASVTVSPVGALPLLGDSINDTYNEQLIKRFLDNVSAEQLDAMYELAEEGLAWTNRDPAASAPEVGAAGTTRMVVRFAKKNGGSVYRQFEIPVDDLLGKFSEASEDPSFRDTYYILDRFNLSKYNGITVVPWGFRRDGFADDGVIELTDGELAEVTSCLKEDAMSCTLAELRESEPVGTVMLNCRENVPESSYRAFDAADYLSSVYVYPQYERTLRFLAEHGMTFDAETDPAKDVTEVYLEHTADPDGADQYGEYYEDENGQHMYAYRTERYVFTDPEEIRELFSVIRPLRPGLADAGIKRDGGVEIRYADEYYCYVDYSLTDKAGFERLISGKEDLNA